MVSLRYADEFFPDFRWYFHQYRRIYLRPTETVAYTKSTVRQSILGSHVAPVLLPLLTCGLQELRNMANACFRALERHGHPRRTVFELLQGLMVVHDFRHVPVHRILLVPPALSEPPRAPITRGAVSTMSVHNISEGKGDESAGNAEEAQDQERGQGEEPDADDEDGELTEFTGHAGPIEEWEDLTVELVQKLDSGDTDGANYMDASCVETLRRLHMLTPHRFVELLRRPWRYSYENRQKLQRVGDRLRHLVAQLIPV